MDIVFAVVAEMQILYEKMFLGSTAHYCVLSCLFGTGKGLRQHMLRSFCHVLEP